jgi:HK97 family phage major capsid protein
MENLTPEQVIAQLKEEFKAQTKGFALDTETKAEIKELKTEFQAELKSMKDATDAEIELKVKKLEDIVAAQGDIINSFKAAKATEAANGSIYDQVKEIFEKNKEGLLAFVQKSAPFKMELKAAGTMTVGVNVTGSTTLLPTPMMTPGYNPARRNPATFLDVANVTSTGSARIAYVDQVNIDGTSATTAEGAAKPAIDADFKVSYSSAVKVAAVTKISDEMLDDIDFMAQAVQDELVSRVRIAISTNIYTYITSGMTPGYTTVNSVYADYYPLARPANLFDVITAAKATVNAGNHVASHVFVNPLDYARLNLVKTTTAEYTQPIFRTPDALIVDGLIVVASNAVAVDKYIVCDLSKLSVAMYKNLTVEAGWENDDFTKNLRTFRGECRIHYYVKDNDKTAFLYGDYTTDADYMTAAS